MQCHSATSEGKVKTHPRWCVILNFCKRRPRWSVAQLSHAHRYTSAVAEVSRLAAMVRPSGELDVPALPPSCHAPGNRRRLAQSDAAQARRPASLRDDQIAYPAVLMASLARFALLTPSVPPRDRGLAGVASHGDYSLPGFWLRSRYADCHAFGSSGPRRIPPSERYSQRAIGDAGWLSGTTVFGPDGSGTHRGRDSQHSRRSVD